MTSAQIEALLLAIPLLAALVHGLGVSWLWSFLLVFIVLIVVALIVCFFVIFNVLHIVHL